MRGWWFLFVVLMALVVWVIVASSGYWQPWEVAIVGAIGGYGMFVAGYHLGRHCW